MAEFGARDVARLRKLTGAGMMDCKQALTDADGDFEASAELLRTRGLAGASKREGRASEQGAVEVLVENGVGAIVELNCETDFVAKGADFAAAVGSLARVAVEQRKEELSDLPFDGGTVATYVASLAAKLGEHVVLGRVVVFETTDGILDGYRHTQNDRGTIGVLVELGGVDPVSDAVLEVAHEVALHVASAAPRYLHRDDVPADVLDKERAILEELTRTEGKPEQAVPKIVEGRLNGFFKDQVLLEQAYVRDPKVTISKLVESLGPGATVRRFARVKIGED